MIQEGPDHDESSVAHNRSCDPATTVVATNPRGSYSKVRANVPVSTVAQPLDVAIVPDRVRPDHVPVQVLMHPFAAASAAVNADPLSVPVSEPVAELGVPGKVLANVPVIDDPDWLSVS